MPFSAIGILFLAVGLRFLLWRRSSGERVAGQVYGYLKDEARAEFPCFRPVARFQYQGRIWYARSAFGSGMLRYPLGRRVTVRVTRNEKPGAPPLALIDDSIWTQLGATFLALGVLALLVASRFPSSQNIPQLILGLTVAAFGWRVLSGIVDKVGGASALQPEAQSAPSWPAVEYLSPALVADIWRKQQRQWLWLTPLALVAGLALGAVGMHWGAKQRDFIEHALTAQGTVARLHSEYDDGAEMYYPVVRFRTPASEKDIEFRSKVGSRPSLYDVGATVSVLYDPRNPSEAMIDFGWLNHAGPAACLGFALMAFFAFFRGLLRLTRRSAIEIPPL